MDNIISSLIVFLGSSLKFSAGALYAIAGNLGLEGSLANIIGGVMGIVLFTYLGGFIQEFFVRRFPNRFGKKFTRSNRFLVRVKRKFGLNGIAAITPIILSIPVGVLFALAFTHDKKKILISMFISVLFWGTIFFLPYFLFNINVMDLVRRLFESH